MGSGGSKDKTPKTSNTNSNAKKQNKSNEEPDKNQTDNPNSSVQEVDKPESNQTNPPNSTQEVNKSESNQINLPDSGTQEVNTPELNQKTAEPETPQTPPANTAGGKFTPRKGSEESKTEKSKSENHQESDLESTKGGNVNTPKEVNSSPPVEENAPQKETISANDPSTISPESSENETLKAVVKVSEVTEDRVIPPDPEDQRKFDDALEFACLLLKPESVMKKITNNVTKLELKRALPLTFNLHTLLSALSNLQELDLHGNNLGPQSFRSICLAMCNNSVIHSLNLSSNQTDTDSAECLGRMLDMNKTLEYLDVSSNYLGKDFFSRNVGPALKTNTTLKTLRAESIGSTDIRVLLEGLLENKSLTEIDFSGNSVSDRTALGKGFAAVLKKPDCCLQTLALSNCEMNTQGLEALRLGLQENKSLCQLNLNGNEVPNLHNLLKIVASAVTHPGLFTFCMDSSKVKDTAINNNLDLQSCVRADTQPVLQILSLSDCHLTNEFWDILAELIKGRQLPVREIDVGANNDLTVSALKSIIGVTSDEENISSLKKLNFSVISQADGLTDHLTSGHCPNLQYLNIRKSRMSDAQNLSQLYCGSGAVLKTMILDGHKLANTDILSTLMGNAVGGSLTTLSIEACSLTADDIVPLCQSLKKGLALHMLKITGNRLEDKGVVDLVEAVLSNKTHPLAVLDVSSNTMGDEGATCLSRLFTTKKHTSQLHSLNISVNNVGKAGILSLVTVIGGKFPLQTLYLQGQSPGLTEPEMEEIFAQLAKALGFTVQKTGETTEKSCSELPNLPEGLRVKLCNLGGNAGETGMLLDSPRIVTDYTQERLPFLSFAHCQVIAAHLKGTDSETCVWSAEEWKMITGANKPTSDTPSWLQLAGSRDLAVYMSNLPGSTTTQKIEAILEMEADCNLDEVCLMKDPVTRSINGVGWGLMCDKESIQKAVDFFNSGEARVFGQPIMIAPVQVHVDDDKNALTEAKAREDQEKRIKQRSVEDQAHRNLIRRTTEESWKRHEYRLAHPAYADGRIW